MSINAAEALVRTRYRGRLRQHDLEDVAHEAYLHYWIGWVNGKGDHPASFHRDVQDACRKLLRHPLLTGLHDEWWEARPA